MKKRVLPRLAPLNDTSMTLGLPEPTLRESDVEAEPKPKKRKLLRVVSLRDWKPDFREITKALGLADTT